MIDRNKHLNSSNCSDRKYLPENVDIVPIRWYNIRKREVNSVKIQEFRDNVEKIALELYKLLPKNKKE